MSIFVRLLFVVYLFSANALIADTPDLQLNLASGLSGVVDINNAGDGSHRLFLVRQAGTVYILEDGELNQTPFLDLRSRVSTVAEEQGLLSIEFAPDYATSGVLYAFYTGIGGGTVIDRLQVSEDPNVVDADSREMILNIPQPADNHNGGRIRFGPDGMLYLGLGDGGGSFDPDGNGQAGNTLLGKLIRIDVDPQHGTYAVPPDNPFVGNGGMLDEIWASGLRNPWRISFDSGTGDLFIADVGQNQWEEVNFQPADSSGGENYGWNEMEGAHCTSGGNDCSTAGKTLPVAEYDHDQGCSVTGGEVYRGAAYPNLVGTYLYADFCSGMIWGLSRDGDDWVINELLDSGALITTFGLAEDGSVYLATLSDVYLISDGEVKVEPLVNINAGFNDAWFNPDTNGQGFYIIVYESIPLMLLSWFTYDTVRPPEDVTAILGEPGHRWLTAQGGYSGATATLTVYLSSGGVFNSPTPAVGAPENMGTMTVTFTDCNTGVVTYDFPGLGLSGSVPIERLALDNIALCEALQ